MRSTTSLAVMLVLVTGFATTGWAQPSGPNIIHDAEYYVLEAQNSERWAAEDKDLDARLSALRQKHGQPPNIVYVLWDDTTFGDFEIFYKRSTDNGSSWAFQRISDNSGASQLPDVSANGNAVTVVWQDNTYEILYDIFSKQSQNNGSNWSFERLCDNAGWSLFPVVAIADEARQHVFWSDSSFANFEIFYKRK